MSLNGALSIGGSALATSQAAIQVTGNNLANVGNPNYSRETANLAASPEQQIKQGVYIGTGVDLTSIQRQVDDALNSRLNSSTSDSEAAKTTVSLSGQIQNVFNALGTNSLDTQVAAFQKDWAQLANSPADVSQRQVVIQDGQTLSQQINSLGSQLATIQSSVGTQLTNLAANASQLSQQIADFNQQIATGGGASNNGLLDQRDAAVSSLSKLVNVQTVNQGNGIVNVYVGSEPLVLGTVSSGLKVATSTQANGQPTYSLQFASNNGTVDATSGQIGATLAGQTQINTVQTQLNSLAGGLIFGVNSIYASGQGTQGYTSVTGTNQVLDPTLALNSAGTSLKFQPVNGSFVITTTNTQTGLSSSTLVPVNLTGQPTDTTLNSLVTSLNAIPNVTATIQGGKLNIASSGSNQQITFSQDSSHSLAALGINTFFQGSDSSTIGVNAIVANNPNLLAAAKNGQPGDNQTALAISTFSSTNVTALGNQSWTATYNGMINQIATTSSQATSNASATKDIVDTLSSQQQALSGVNIDDETINMIQQQRSYQGAAMFISTVNQMMASLLAITL